MFTSEILKTVRLLKYLYFDPFRNVKPRSYLQLLVDFNNNKIPVFTGNTN
jgi:hypothetical protein